MRRIRHNFKQEDKPKSGKRSRSKKEEDYCCRLKILQKSGVVVFFLRNVPFDLPEGEKYKVDFVVFFSDGHCEFVNLRRNHSDVAIAKKKILETLYPVEIIELE